MSWDSRLLMVSLWLWSLEAGVKDGRVAPMWKEVCYWMY